MAQVTLMLLIGSALSVILYPPELVFDFLEWINDSRLVVGAVWTLVDHRDFLINRDIVLREVI